MTSGRNRTGSDQGTQGARRRPKDGAKAHAKSQAAMNRAKALAREGMADCTGFNLRKAARAVSQYYDAVMQESGLRGTQFSLLASIAARGPVTISHLARHMVMDRTTLTRNLKPLMAQGLVAVEAGEDRRSRLASLTDDGVAALGRALPYWREAHSGMTRRLGREGRDRLLRSLADTIAAARGD